MRRSGTIVLYLIVFLLVSNIGNPCFAGEGRLSGDEQNRRLYLFEIAVSGMSPDRRLSVFTVKTATDVLGNKYSIIECNPTGYMIFCENSGVFVEYSPSAPSPYMNKYGRLYYFGPTYYYCDKPESTELEHTLFGGEHISYSEMALFSDTCNRFLEYNLKQRNEVVLDYIRKGSYSSVLAGNEAKQVRSSSGSVSHYSFFANMTTPCGSCLVNGSNNYCGYTGLALLIAYRDSFTSDLYMSDAYWDDDNESFLRNGSLSLTWYLRAHHGTKDSVNSAEIKAVSESYFQEIGLNATHTSKSWGLFNRYTIMNAIDNDDPVLLIGNFDDPVNSGNVINHAVVAYAYTHQGGLFGSTVYTAHFGIDYYSEVYVTGSIGSIYILN